MSSLSACAALLEGEIGWNDNLQSVCVIESCIAQLTGACKGRCSAAR